MRRGAYGLHLEAPAEIDDLLVAADPGWPTATIELRRGAIDGVAAHVDTSQATFVFADAVARVDRERSAVTFEFGGVPRHEAVVHPYLAPIAGLFAHWRGREALHAGAFVVDGVAWGLVAGREGGKSTTLARLALEGVPIIADDLLVVDGDDALAGPRAIDLREAPARELGMGEPLGVLGARPRWRVRVPDVASATPVKGWVFLEWGEKLEIQRVSARYRLEWIGAQRMIRQHPTDPSAFLRLASLPAIVVRRPRSWATVEQTAGRMLDLLRESEHG